MAFSVAALRPSFVLRSGVNKSVSSLRARTVVGVRKNATIRSRSLVVRAEEKKDTMSALDSMLPADEKEEEPKKEELFDDGKEPPKPQMSMEQRKKLRDEYLSLGGSPNTAMPNYFLYIIVVISALAVASALTGAI